VTAKATETGRRKTNGQVRQDKWEQVTDKASPGREEVPCRAVKKGEEANE